MNKKILALILSFVSISAVSAGDNNNVQFRNRTSLEVVVGIKESGVAAQRDIRLQPGFITDAMPIGSIEKVVARYGGQSGGKMGLGTEGSWYDNKVPMVNIHNPLPNDANKDIIVNMDESDKKGWFGGISNTIDFNFEYNDPSTGAYNAPPQDEAKFRYRPTNFNDADRGALAELGLGNANNITAYDILGVKRNDQFSTIKKAYFKLAKNWHSDKHSGASKDEQEKAEAVFKIIGLAFSDIKHELGRN